MLESISAITLGPISLDGSFYQAALYAVCAHSVGATQPGSSPEGRWLTEKKNGIVEIFRCSGGDVLCGRLVWFRLKLGDSNLDLSNADPKLRNKPASAPGECFGAAVAYVASPSLGRFSFCVLRPASMSSKKNAIGTPSALLKP